MSKGLINNYIEGDDDLIYNYDTYTVAIELKLDPEIIENWSEERMQRIKTTMRVQANKAKGG